MNVKNKIIALDIGHVLARVDMSLFHRKLVELGYSMDEEEADLFSSAVQASFDTGMLDMRQALHVHFPKMKRDHVKQVIKSWEAVVTPCGPTMEALDEILSAGATVALLSNIGLDHAAYLSRICFRQFDRCKKHFSCDVGARKPTKLYYQSLLLELGSLHLPIIFLDDRIENVEAAKTQNFSSQLFDIEKYDSDEDAAADLIKIVSDF